MYEHICLIYNPYAGGLRGAKLRRLRPVEEALKAQARRVSLHKTRGPGTAGEVARECVAAGADLIVAAGGDGTINEAAVGMTGSEVPLGILPAGTANVLACEIGIGTNMERAAKGLSKCVPHRISMGTLEIGGATREFLLMAGTGLDASIVFSLNSVMKAKLGKAAYWLNGARMFLRKLDEFEVESNGARHKCSFALITKVRNYGGDFEIAREVRILDDEFEVVLFEGTNTFRYLVYFAGVAARRLRGMPGVTTYRASRVRLTPRNGVAVHCQVDGEYAGELPATVRSDGRRLTLLIPQRYFS